MNYTAPIDKIPINFYNVNVHNELEWSDVYTYYVYLFGYVGVSSSFIYLILFISNIVDGYFETNEADEDGEGEGEGEGGDGSGHSL